MGMSMGIIPIPIPTTQLFLGVYHIFYCHIFDKDKHCSWLSVAWHIIRSSSFEWNIKNRRPLAVLLFNLSSNFISFVDFGASFGFSILWYNCFF